MASDDCPMWITRFLRPGEVAVLLQAAQGWAERGRLPDALVRIGIRQFVAQRLREVDPRDADARRVHLDRWIAELRQSPIALQPAAANAQHYELPQAFFQQVLGPHLKYSCCLWSPGVTILQQAEEEMLALTCERAQIEDGQRILELGCGWGSLAFWIAERYPYSHILAVSNSRLQREFITSECTRRGITNLEVVTADMNTFDAGERFDRVVSIEMFEHMRNYALLLERISKWLRPAGRLFVHVFAHRCFSYPFEVKGPGDWMARYFFAGGLMPSDDLLPQFDDHFTVEDQWRLDGTHYEHTANAWLGHLDRHRDRVYEVLVDHYGAQAARMWLGRWRIFFMACAELFGYRAGSEWGVCHYRLRPHRSAPLGSSTA